MVAFGIIWIFFVIFVSALTYITLSELVNELIVTMNDFLAAGNVTGQFVTYWNLSISLWMAIPLILLIGIVGWAYVRALEGRQEV